MYSNVLKQRMGSREDDLCRFCQNYSESREYILFECCEVAGDVRSEYTRKVSWLLKKNPDDLCLEFVLGLDVRLTKRCVQGLAVALWMYLEQIGYKA